MATRRSASQLARGAANGHARENDLDCESWLDYLSSVTTPGLEPGEAARINGQRITETQRRAVSRWRNEGCSPSIFTADRFLTQSGLHLSDYFIHCHVYGLRPWARGVPPSWHEADWWWEDFE